MIDATKRMPDLQENVTMERSSREHRPTTNSDILVNIQYIFFLSSMTSIMSGSQRAADPSSTA